MSVCSNTIFMPSLLQANFMLYFTTIKKKIKWIETLRIYGQWMPFLLSTTIRCFPSFARSSTARAAVLIPPGLGTALPQTLHPAQIYTSATACDLWPCLRQTYHLAAASDFALRVASVAAGSLAISEEATFCIDVVAFLTFSPHRCPTGHF